MAEDVNFPLDQERRASAFQGLRENSQDTGRSRRIEDQEEDSKNPERTEKQQPVNEVASLEARIEISQEARQKAGGGTENPAEQPETQQDIAQAERRELQTNRQEASEDAQSDFRNPGSQGPAGANELSRVSEGSVQDPEEQLNDQERSGNDLTNPDRIEEFQNGAQIDSVREATVRAGENATSVEQENPSRPLEGPPSIRESLEEGRPTQGRESLEENIKNAPPSPEDRLAETLEQTTPNDARVQQRLQEERAEKAEARAKNEPALETPEQSIEPVEKPSEPLREAVDNNPLRGPRLSELKDESDATAVETERGQNVSNLI